MPNQGKAEGNGFEFPEGSVELMLETLKRAGAKEAREIAELLEERKEYRAAAQAYQAALEKGKPSKPLMFKIATLFALAGDFEGARNFLDKMKKTRVESSWIEGVARIIGRAERPALPEPEASSVQPPEETGLPEEPSMEEIAEASEEGEKVTEHIVKGLLRRYGIDPEESAEDIIISKETALRKAAEDLDAQIPVFNLEECRRVLSREEFIDKRLGGKEEGYVTTVDRIKELRTMLSALDKGEFEPPERYEFWVEYLDTLFAAWRGLEAEQAQYAEVLRDKAKERLLELLPQREKKAARKTSVARLRVLKEALEEEVFGKDQENETQESLAAALGAIEIRRKSAPEAASEIGKRAEKTLSVLDTIIKDASKAESADEITELEVRLEAATVWYDEIDKSAIAQLLYSLERRRPGLHAPDETIDYWRRYVEEIDNKLISSGDQIAAKREAVNEAIAQARAMAHAKEDERAWQEGGLQEAVANEVERIIEELRKLQAQGRVREGGEMAKARSMALGNAEWELFLGFRNKEHAFDRANLRTEVVRAIEKWKAVIEHFNKKLTGPYSEDEINKAITAVRNKRTHPSSAKDFRYRRSSLNWSKLRKEEIREGQKPALEQILEFFELEPASFEAEATLDFFDYLEAYRSISEIRKARREQREQERRARQEEWEKLSPKERFERLNYEARAEFFALAAAWSKGRKDEVEAFFKAREERRELLRKMYLRAIEERGISVPGVQFRDSGSGEAAARQWDSIIVADEAGQLRNIYGQVEEVRLIDPVKPDEPASYAVVLREKDLITGEDLGKRTVNRADVRDYKLAQASSLDGRVAVDLLRLAGAKMSHIAETLTGPVRRNVFYVRPGRFVKGTLAVNTGRRHGDKFWDGYDLTLDRSKPPERRRPKPGTAEELFQEYFALRKGRKHDQFDWSRVDTRTLTEFLDHHSPESGKDTAGTRFLYEKLSTFGCFEKLSKEDRKALEAAIQFVVWDDNKSHPDWLKEKGWWEEKWATDAPRTLLGLTKQLDLNTLIKFYKKYGGEQNPELKALSNEELAEFGLTAASENQKNIVEGSMRQLDALEKDGFVIDDTVYGKLTVLVPLAKPRYSKGERAGWGAQARSIPGGIDAIRARHGKDSALLIWNPFEDNGGHIFISTAGRSIGLLPSAARFQIGDTETVRGTMIHGAGLHGSLKEFMLGLMPEGRLDARGAMGRYLFGSGSDEGSEIWQWEQLRMERYDDQAMLRERVPQLYAPTPLIHEGQEVKVPISWLAPGVRAVIEVPRGFDPRTIGSGDRYYLEVKRMVRDKKTGQEFYIAGIKQKVARPQEADRLEHSLRQTAIRRLTGQGFNLREAEQSIPRYEVARLLSKAWRSR